MQILGPFGADFTCKSFMIILKFERCQKKLFSHDSIRTRLPVKTRLTSRPKTLEVCLAPRETGRLTDEVPHHWIAVGPSEVPLEHLVVEAKPLVVASQTCVGGKANGKNTGQAAPVPRPHLQQWAHSRSAWDARRRSVLRRRKLPV